jgi:hypothetical protein
MVGIAPDQGSSRGNLAVPSGEQRCQPSPHQSFGSSPHIPLVDGNNTTLQDQDQDQERNICGGINMKVFHDIEAAREKRFREMEAETEKLIKMMQNQSMFNFKVIFE